MGDEKVALAAKRIEEMAQVAADLSSQPHSVSDPKYGVHGGQHDQQVSTATNGGNTSVPFKGRLFYCGGAQGRQHDYKKYSTFGLFLAKSLLPDYEGTIEIDGNNKVSTSATPLTADTMNSASENDFLIVHSHQHCDVSVSDFPGIQLHINVSKNVC